MQIVFGYMFIFNITGVICLFLTSQVSNCKTFVKPFPIFFYSFHRHRNTYTFIVIIGVFIVCNVIICLHFVVAYTE
jgi:formate/nitrite transporter FocA (FNT family)